MSTDVLQPTASEIFLFDLRGYLLLENALSAAEVAACNAEVDDILPLAVGQWAGYIHGHQFGTDDGLNLQQIYEAGPAFENLIDHPAWVEKLKFFVGGEGTFDYKHGPLFIDENFVNLRGPGEAIGIHSGGHAGSKRNQFRFHAGRFMNGQVNLLIALTDIGPGDGATMLIPGSHKSNFPPPNYDDHTIGVGGSADAVVAAEEVYMKAGDALLFTDTICHGSARRTSPHDRRIVVYRYGPSWGFFRHGYRPSPELLARLTPARRQIVWPHDVMERKPQK